ncbi:lytic transglycosylase domain-containing protein [Microvirga sp. Mcv34]|uniref:lytic transglycosylase domain-containing protein n=1 Tax=Microvirga sp. Mcv34 TaxID=2926016 RepID=UPI0021C66F60|nr:transglycosylase SLT domain-containing protein [Microvirga sp. Mcv34]
MGLDAYRPKGRGSYLPLIVKEAERQGLPAAVADAVVMVESSYNPSVIGTVGELGLMQVRPGTAAMLGFTGPREALADPQVNIRYGIEYLAKAWRLTGGDLCRALMKYRAGHGEERMTPRSIEYCRRARVHLAAIGSPLANQGAADPVGLSVQPVQVASAQPLPLEREPRLTIQEQRRAAFQRELVKRFIVSVANVGSQSKAEAVKRTGTLSKAGEVEIGRKPTVPLGRKP